MLETIKREHVVIPMEGATPMGAYLAQPQAPAPRAAVMVGMELFGVNQHIREIADRVAALGYLAIAPDFYHRSEASAELSYDQAGRDKGFELLHQLGREDALADVAATLRYLRQRPDCQGRVGFLGFSVGGHIGYLAATRLDLTACAVFYAGWLTNTSVEMSQPEPTLTLTPGIAKTGTRMLYFVGEDDFLVTADQREAISHALTQAKVRHEVIVYPGVGHGFFCDERDSFDAATRDDAWARTCAMFETELHA